MQSVNKREDSRKKRIKHMKLNQKKEIEVPCFRESTEKWITDLLDKHNFDPNKIIQLINKLFAKDCIL